MNYRLRLISKLLTTSLTATYLSDRTKADELQVETNKQTTYDQLNCDSYFRPKADELQVETNKQTTYDQLNCDLYFRPNLRLNFDLTATYVSFTN